MLMGCPLMRGVKAMATNVDRDVWIRKRLKEQDATKKEECQEKELRTTTTSITPTEGTGATDGKAAGAGGKKH